MDAELTLFHGSPNEICIPQYGLGEEKHDYGKGFYLTFDAELAKEWAVCDSFFSFSKQAIRGEVDIKLLDEIMHTGRLGLQVFIQSEKAFNALKEIKSAYEKMKRLFIPFHTVGEDVAVEKIINML